MQRTPDKNGIPRLSGMAKLFYDKLTGYLCQFGYTYPPDPISGVVIDGVEYPVVVTLSGKYLYIDAEGKRHCLPYGRNNEPEFDWVNINEKHMESTEQCFNTGNGEVHVVIYHSVNDQLEIRKSKYYVLNSTNSSYPIGTELSEIPSTWTYKDCEIPDMTDRDVEITYPCYSTTNGKVHLEATVSYDHVLGRRVAQYSVLQSTDSTITVGSTLSSLGNGWVRIACDFADLTQRHLAYVQKCYNSTDGNVTVYGTILYNNSNVQQSIRFTVMSSTDSNISVGTVWTSIPTGYSEVICS